jgi:FkbM family methyltransferase
MLTGCETMWSQGEARSTGACMTHTLVHSRPVAPIVKRAALRIPAIRRLHDDRERLTGDLAGANRLIADLRTMHQDELAVADKTIWDLRDALASANKTISDVRDTLASVNTAADRRRALLPARTTTLKNVAGLEQLNIELFLHPEPDAISECISRFGHWEQTETKFVLEQIKPGHRVLDLGANLGYYTALFSRLAGENGVVVAFEPEGDNFQLLTFNVAHNRLGNVSVIKAVVGAISGIAELQHHADNRGAHMVFPSDSPEFVRTSRHPRIALDDLLGAGFEHVDFIKMDTQGSEPLIVAGGRELIARNSKHLTMIVEFCPVWIQNCCGRKPLSFYQEVLAFGFDGYFIHPLRNEILPVDDPVGLIKTVEACDGIAWPKAACFVDLIFRPRL